MWAIELERDWLTHSSSFRTDVITRICHGVCGVCGCLSWSRVAVSVGKRHVAYIEVTRTDLGTSALKTNSTPYFLSQRMCHERLLLVSTS